MEIKIIKNGVKKEELQKIASQQYGNLVKAVVDVEKEIMAIGGELHADEEVFLTEKEDSKRENTWGINIYPEKDGEEMIEIDSIINIKPFCGNRSRGVEDPIIKEKIIAIVKKLII